MPRPPLTRHQRRIRANRRMLAVTLALYALIALALAVVLHTGGRS
ncbi:hypothetical protein UFOVP703_35 [uncultured Caudovirales phage]|uniref:Uncharacterized protein n=1 Tax=uncultured Caudovirales phage TaxID=2100421 RepID=A0A6J5NNV8_9CAUD|nr:hypothetical protein UFOVP703_35 [uncultured Caudovirales phage]